MLRSLEDIKQNIIDAIEPLDFADRLNLTAEEIIEVFDISTEELVEKFGNKIGRNIRRFDDVTFEDEGDGC